MSVNKVILVGNVGKDAEVRHIDSGVAVASFPFATSENYTAKSGEKVTSTEWHNIVAWRGLAEFAGEYIKKGRQLYIEGRIRTRSYDDKDGVKKYFTEILADKIQLLGRKDQDNDDSRPSNNYQQTAPEKENVNENDMGEEPGDDLPF